MSHQSVLQHGETYMAEVLFADIASLQARTTRDTEVFS